MEGRDSAGGTVEETILDSLVEHVVRHDRQLRIVWANRAACESAGLTREEIIGRHCYELWACRDDPCPDCPVTAAMGSGEHRVAERVMPDGRAWIVSGYPVRDAGGHIIGGIEISLEITDRKRAEDALRESQALLTATIDNLPFDFFALDPEGRCMLQNAYCRRRWGDAIGRRTVDVAIDEETRSLWLSNNRRALAGETIDEEVEFISRGGTGHYRNIITPIRDEGFIRGVLGVNIDITEQKRAEAALQAERDLLNAIIQTSIAAIAIVGREGRITFVNPQAERVLGQDARQILARTFNAPEWRIASEDGDAMPDEELPFARVMRTGEPVFDARHAIEWPDGTRRLLSINGAPLRTGTGEVGSVVFAMNDITEQKRIEEQRLAHLRFLESLGLIDQAIRQATDLEEMMSEVLETTRSVFDCDRAWLLYPCDPTATSWEVPMERTTPDYPGAMAVGVEIPVDADVARGMRLLLESDGPVRFGPGSEHPLPAEASRRFGYQSQLAMAVYPKTGGPWMFGLHQCSGPRQWSGEEERLFQAIGGRIADALTTLLMLRDLRESRRALATLMDNLPGMAYRCLCDEHWTMRFVSDGCAELTGYRPEDVVNNAVVAYADLIHPDDRRSVREDIEEAIDAHDVFQIVYRIRTARGAERWVWEQGRGVFSKDGRLEALEGFIADITERTQNEQALRRERDLLQSIMQTSTAAIIRIDASGRFVFANAAAERVTGLTDRQLLERSHNSPEWELTDLRGRPIPEAENPVQRVLDAGRPVLNQELAITAGSGQRRLIRLSGAPLRDDADRIVSAVILIEDITERKQAEEDLRFQAMLISQSLDMVTATDLEGRITYVNDAVCRHLNKPADRLIGQHVECYGEDPRRGATQREIIEATLARGHWRGEVINVAEDGREYIIDCRTQLVRNEHGTPTGMVGISADITERKRAEEALVASERNYRTIYDAANDAIFIHDAQSGRILDVNHRMTELFGYTREEARELSVGDLSSGEPPFTHEEAQRLIHLAADEGPQIFQWLCRRKDGEMFWVEVNLKSALIGGEERVLAVVRDITERKRAEAALQESEDRFRCLSAASVEGIVIHDQGTVIDANEAFARLFGYDRPEVPGMHAADFFPPESLAIVMQTIRTGSEEPYEAVARRSDGTLFPVELVGRTMPYRGRSARVAAVRDITERKRAEETLRDREARLRLMIEQIPAVLWTVDPNLRFTSSQGRGLGKLGHRPGEMVGVSLQEYFRTDDPDALPIRAHRRALEGESVSYQMAWAGCHFDTHVEPLRDGEGRIIGAIGTAHDVTERRQAEQEARQRAESERLLLRELDHRVRNNLSSLISLTDMTAGSADDVPTFAASITSRVRAIATTHALLSTSQWHHVQLRPLIMAMVLGKRGSAVHLEGPPVEIPAAQVQAVGIVINELMTNSHKYGALSTPEGRLSIRWELVDEDEELRRLVMHWHELGGPPIAQSPDRGVGIELVEGLVRSELRGGAVFDFTADGARHRLDMRLEEPEAASP